MQKIQLGLDVSEVVANAGRAREAIAAFAEEVDKTGRAQELPFSPNQGGKPAGGILTHSEKSIPQLELWPAAAPHLAETQRAFPQEPPPPVPQPVEERFPQEPQPPTSQSVETQDNFPQPPPPRDTAPQSPDPTAIGGLLSGADAVQSAIRNLDAHIENARKTGDPKLGTLYYNRDNLKTSAAGLERDIGAILKNPKFKQLTEKQIAGKELTKGEERYISRLETLIESLKKNTAAVLESSKTAEEVQVPAAQVAQNSADFHKLVGDETTGQKAQNAVQAIGVVHLANAINDGFSRWVGTLDRSGIVNQYGSGDILGGRISEKRRNADFWGGIAQSGLGIAGTLLGFTPIGAAIGGPMVTGSLGAASGKALDSFLHEDPNKDATKAAYAGLWQNRSGQAMELAAITGSAHDVRGAFTTAADAAARFGYSAEEGMDAMKQAAQQGLDRQQARELTEQVFSYERNTGADRGTLIGLSTMAGRYGMGDAVGAGWQGLQASGMKAGQYNEYLRAMQRVMEDGISKGFVRSSEEVTQNLTMLSHMTGNDPLWQGENGARRLMEMNSGLESATSLSSASDIIAYRAARNISGGGSYIEAMKVLEKGLTPTLFKEYMKLTGKAEGGGKEGTIERMRQTFNLNYTNANALYDAYQKNPNDDSWQALLKQFTTKPLDAKSPELDAAKTTEAIKNWWVQTGMSHWDKNFPKTLAEELAKAIQQYTGSNVPAPAYTSGMTPIQTSLHPPSTTFEDINRIQTRGLSVIGSFFTEKEDKADKNNMYRTFESALNSGDESQIQNAADVLKKLEAISKDPKEVRERWDKENLINPLANSNDIKTMLSLLKDLIKVEVDNGNMSFTIVDY